MSRKREKHRSLNIGKNNKFQDYPKYKNNLSFCILASLITLLIIILIYSLVIQTYLFPISSSKISGMVVSYPNDIKLFMPFNSLSEGACVSQKCPTIVSGGKNGSAGNFNNAYINTTNLGSFKSQTIAVSAWIRKSDLIGTTYSVPIYTKTQSYNTYVDGLELSASWSDFVSCNFGNGSVSQQGYLRRSLNYKLNKETGDWVNIICQSDGKQVKFYVNGKNVGNYSISSLFYWSGSSDPFIGGCINESRCYKGLIDEVKIYGRNLSSEEVIEEYNLYNSPVILDSCTDEDGDKALDSSQSSQYYAKNSVNYILSGQQGTKDDFCIDEKNISEYYCDGTMVKSSNFTCPNGCQNGACILPISNICIDSDNGAVYNLKGFVNDSFHIYQDECLDSSIIKEYFCTEKGLPTYEKYSCSEICENGECISYSDRNNSNTNFTCEEGSDKCESNTYLICIDDQWIESSDDFGVCNFNQEDNLENNEDNVDNNINNTNEQDDEINLQNEDNPQNIIQPPINQNKKSSSGAAIILIIFFIIAILIVLSIILFFIIRKNKTKSLSSPSAIQQTQIPPAQPPASQVQQQIPQQQPYYPVKQSVQQTTQYSPQNPPSQQPPQYYPQNQNQQYYPTQNQQKPQQYSQQSSVQKNIQQPSQQQYYSPQTNSSPITKQNISPQNNTQNIYQNPKNKKQ